MNHKLEQLLGLVKGIAEGFRDGTCDKCGGEFDQMELSREGYCDDCIDSVDPDELDQHWKGPGNSGKRPGPDSGGDDEAYGNAEMDDALLLEPVGVINGEFKVKINGGEYGYKPGPNYSGDISALEKEFLYKMAYPGKALTWLKANTQLTSRPGGGKIAQAPSVKSKEVGSFDIPSSSGSGSYMVKKYDDGSWTCECPHHKHRGVECKHIKAAQDQQDAVPTKIAASATGV